MQLQNTNKQFDHEEDLCDPRGRHEVQHPGVRRLAQALSCDVNQQLSVHRDTEERKCFVDHQVTAWEKQTALRIRFDISLVDHSQGDEPRRQHHDG